MDNDGGITDSDTSSYTSSDTKSDASSNDIVSSRGPYAYLLQWYDDGFDESVPEFKFNKRTVCKSKASKKRHSNSKQVPTLQPGFALPLSTIGSVADNERKGKRNVRSDKSKEFPNPPPEFPFRVPIVGSSVDYEGKGKKIVGIENDMSNLDELRHTDNTTLLPPRLPDTLPQVYHRRRPTLGLLILPSVPSFSPTIRCTARMSVLPIEPNLREEALTAYGTETGQSSVPVPKTVLTVCTTRLRGQLHTILEDMDRYPNAYLEELEAFLTLWDVKPRVEESLLETLSVGELISQLRQVCEDAEDHDSNAQEEARQKRKEALEEVVQQIYRSNN
ncbi:hypothetical protein Tco_0752732 [Tanacetum coccineum]|uniref:Uncharacterized protein n=1 Tax=Tanacetum coccineum TaxID=301880 RepID=A0ABQ4ZAB5_9ASTR